MLVTHSLTHWLFWYFSDEWGHLLNLCQTWNIGTIEFKGRWTETNGCQQRPMNTNKDGRRTNEGKISRFFKESRNWWCRDVFCNIIWHYWLFVPVIHVAVMVVTISNGVIDRFQTTKRHCASHGQPHLAAASTGRLVCTLTGRQSFGAAMERTGEATQGNRSLTLRGWECRMKSMKMLDQECDLRKIYKLSVWDQSCTGPSSG